MMIGILSADEVALAPKALHRASDCGIKEALVDWLAAPPIGDPDHVRARAAFREAIIAGAENAELRCTPHERIKNSGASFKERNP
jgi:hypothetical protein